jgi:hypothetical protein
MVMRKLAAIALFLVAATADAAGERVRLAEVHASDARHEAVLRTATLEALAKLDSSRVPASKEALLSVALVKLESEAKGESRAMTCVVSASLRTKKSGVLVAILEGRARVEGRGEIAPASVIAAAARGAVARVPEALR